MMVTVTAWTRACPDGHERWTGETVHLDGYRYTRGEPDTWEMEL